MGDADRLFDDLFDSQGTNNVLQLTDPNRRRQATTNSLQSTPQLPGSDREWYLVIDGVQVGPLTVGEIEERWEVGDIELTTLVWKPDMADWLAVSSVPELARFAQLPSSESATSPLATGRPTGAVTTGSPNSGRRRITGSLRYGEQQAQEIAWKPSAAQGLASLVQTEMGAAKSSPAPRAATTAELSAPGFAGLELFAPNGTSTGRLPAPRYTDPLAAITPTHWPATAPLPPPQPPCGRFTCCWG